MGAWDLGGSWGILKDPGGSFWIGVDLKGYKGIFGDLR